MKLNTRLLAVAVLVLTLLLARHIALSQPVSQSVDTAWIEAHVAEQNSNASMTRLETPTDTGTLAAILAAELLLTPIDYSTHLPLIVK